jgi:hypothetical protein
MKVLPSASTFIGCACYSKNIMFVFLKKWQSLKKTLEEIFPGRVKTKLKKKKKGEIKVQ